GDRPAGARHRCRGKSGAGPGGRDRDAGAARRSREHGARAAGVRREPRAGKAAGPGGAPRDRERIRNGSDGERVHEHLRQLAREERGPQELTTVCGISGIFDGKGRRAIDRALVERMNASLHHRGPDAGGVHLEPGVALAHRRLSIIDLSTGQQPLYNEDGSVRVGFNGEIYTFQELAKELADAGHNSRTRSDTEVIVHGWEQWGASCVTRFRGMFAFALWDRNSETLFLARDRLGVKPLYYSQLPDGHWIFGSELKALLVHPGVSRAIDPLAVEAYFGYGCAPAPRPILRGVFRLPRACTLTRKRGAPGAARVEYGAPPFKVGSAPSEDDARAELIERLRESVKLRLISEVPLGAFLSGGVDSSGVVAMMSGLSADPEIGRAH